MAQLNSINIDDAIRASLDAHDLDALERAFGDQSGPIVLPDFMPRFVLDGLIADLPKLRSAIHRRYVPGHRRGGSISRHALDRLAPPFGAVYESPPLLRFLESVTGLSLEYGDEGDPHAYAVYRYSEPGDHVGWHLDASPYEGRRFTLLMGLVENRSCLLECAPHRDDASHEADPQSFVIRPGTMVFFEGGKLWHRLTPLADGDGERVVLTMQYSTDVTISPWRRTMANLRDASGYFGFREVFLGPHRRS